MCGLLLLSSHMSQPLIHRSHSPHATGISHFLKAQPHRPGFSRGSGETTIAVVEARTRARPRLQRAKHSKPRSGDTDGRRCRRYAAWKNLATLYHGLARKRATTTAIHVPPLTRLKVLSCSNPFAKIRAIRCSVLRVLRAFA